MPEQRALNKFN